MEKGKSICIRIILKAQNLSYILAHNQVLQQLSLILYGQHPKVKMRSQNYRKIGPPRTQASLEELPDAAPHVHLNRIRSNNKMKQDHLREFTQTKNRTGSRRIIRSPNAATGSNPNQSNQKKKTNKDPPTDLPLGRNLGSLDESEHGDRVSDRNRKRNDLES